MKFVAGENGRNSERNLLRLRFPLHQDTYMELPRREIWDPSGGRRASNPRVRKSRYSGEKLQSPMHCCDVTTLPYLFSGEL